MAKAYVPISSTDIYSGDTTKDYLKPSVSYLEYLYSKGIRFNLSQYQQNLSASELIYTIPDNYTLFITSIAVKSSIGINADFSFFELRVNAGVTYEPLIALLGSNFGETGSGHTLSINPSMPIQLNQKETIYKYIISINEFALYDFQIIGFLVENRFLLI